VRVDPVQLGAGSDRLYTITAVLQEAHTELRQIVVSLSDPRVWTGKSATQFGRLGGQVSANLGHSSGPFEDAYFAIYQLQQWTLNTYNPRLAGLTSQTTDVETQIAATKAQIANPAYQAQLPALHAQLTQLNGELNQISRAYQNLQNDMRIALNQATSALHDAASAVPRAHWAPTPLPLQQLDLPATPNSSDYYAPFVGVLFSGPPTASQVQQGDLGDCYLLASAAAIAMFQPQWLENRIVDEGNGIFGVTLTINGQTQTYTVDANLLVGPGQTFEGDIPTNGKVSDGVLWPAIVEKAYADATGGYPNMDNGNAPSAALQALTGQGTAWQGSRQGPSGMAAFLAGAVQNGQPAVLNTLVTPPAIPGVSLVPDHAYFLESYDPSTGMVQLGNPWGTDNPPPMTVAQICQAFQGATAIV
jgi:Calpain family cysteine protease